MAEIEDVDNEQKQLVGLGYPPKVVAKQLRKKRNSEIQSKHEQAITHGLAVMKEGFVKVDHFDNIYRIQPKFEGAPNLRQVSGYQIYGTGQPNKSSIINLCNIWFKQMKLNKCLWINMRSEPVMYVKDISLSPRDPKHPSENIDFGEEGIITIKDLNLFNKQLEKTVKQNIKKDSNIFKYHKDTYAPLPADRKDRILQFKVNNIKKDVYGLNSLYKNLKEKQKLNIKLQRITVLDEKAPEPTDICKIVNVITKETDDNTAIVFNCMMGKGRTTEGMIIATLIKQILRNKNKNKNSKKKGKKVKSEQKMNDKWPTDVPIESEEVISFHKKLKKQQECKNNDPNNVTDEEKYNGKFDNYVLSIKDMKKGNFTLIKNLIKLLKDKYKLNGNKIKNETDDVINRCQHLQNMRECVFLCLERYTYENRENQKGYWKKISKQYLQRYYVLICFNAYLHDVIIKQKKTFDDISYGQWIKKKKSLTKGIGTLKNGALAEFNWN